MQRITARSALSPVLAFGLTAHLVLGAAPAAGQDVDRSPAEAPAPPAEGLQARGEAMLGRADAGVQIRGVFETTGSDTAYSYYPHMEAAEMANVDVRTDGNPQIMHHKVIIIDRETVIFGSFNFSDSANRKNDENIVIVHDPIFTNFFVQEMESVWAEAKADS